MEKGAYAKTVTTRMIAGLAAIRWVSDVSHFAASIIVMETVTGKTNVHKSSFFKREGKTNNHEQLSA